MDIKIEAQNHGNQELLIRHYNDLLEKRYGKYPFVKSIDLKIDHTPDGTKVGIRIKPEKGNSLFVSTIDDNEHNASRQSNKKMSRLIKKYKERHYRNVDSSHKLSI